MSIPKLFQPIQVGELNLRHRVVMAPLTRFRASDDHVPGPHHTVYYSQRASAPGTLIITEATYISPEAGGFGNAPGIWSEEQIHAWKEVRRADTHVLSLSNSIQFQKVTSAVHAKGSYIFLQLWALGRTAWDPAYKPGLDYPLVSAGDIGIKGQPTPRPLTKEEIKSYVANYAKAARNAVHLAGFDGVEIHNANGYLLDQFVQDVSNNRPDEYGGSIENRARFSLEIVEAVEKEVGQTRMGIRFSPWGQVQGTSTLVPCTETC
jgi:NADPH2 dehydrogenase